MIRQGTGAHIPGIFPLRPDEFPTGELGDQSEAQV